MSKTIIITTPKTQGTESFSDTAIVGGPRQRTGYSGWLWGGRSGDQIHTGTKFSGPVQKVPETHPTPNTMGTGPFPGINLLGLGIKHQPPTRAEFKGSVLLYSPILVPI